MAGQCWNNRYCNSIGIAWSDDGISWVNATHLSVQTPSTADAQCGLIRTPIGIVPEPKQCAGCYSVLWTGWRAPTASLDPAHNLTVPPGHLRPPAASRLGHAVTKDDCPADNAHCQTYQGFKPICAALIRDNEEASGRG